MAIIVNRPASAIALAAGLFMAMPAPAQDTPASAFDAAFAPDAAAPADGARLIAEAMFPASGRREAFFGASIEAIQAQMRMNAVRGIADAGLRKVVEDYIAAIPERLEPVAGKHDAAILAAVAAWLARDFSADELRDIRIFAGTAGGARFIARQAALPDDVEISRLLRAFSADAVAVLAADRAALAEKVRAYIAEHPEAAPRRPEPPAGAEGR